MILLTNYESPADLQLYLLLKFSNEEFKVKRVNVKDTDIKEIKQIPILQLRSGVQLFQTSAVAKYLFPNEENRNVRDEWLEWITCCLAPALECNRNPKILNRLLGKLNNKLGESPFLIGNTLSSVDITLWGLLAAFDVLKTTENKHLIKWYAKMAQIITTKTEFEDFKFSSLHISNRFEKLQLSVLTTTKTSPTLQAENCLTPDTISDEELALAKKFFIYYEDKKMNEPRTVLPKKGEKNILITSALPYVNNVPHLGNIIGCVLSADIFARFCRLCRYNTLFICGTDEYGTATETKAFAENLTPREICDKYFEIHNSTYRWFGIGFDYFGRTSSNEQTNIVQEYFKVINNAGYIEEQIVEQLLCQKCNRFLADRFVEGICPHPGCGYEDARGDQCDKCSKLINAIDLIKPRCKVCNSTPVICISTQLFLNLPKIEPKLVKWIESSDKGWTHNARVITKSWIKEGLKSRCITRDLKWGIPVPLKNFESKVFYVWFDAPIGYISITSKYTKDYKMWWQPPKDIEVELYQFMAKDNVPFHSVMFPATILAMDAGHTLVSHIMATEYLNYEDGKFSKSRGVGVFGNDAMETGIPADIWRFYLAAVRPEGQDSTFSWNDLCTRNNSELLNNLGNFINRSLSFCEKTYKALVPEMNLTNDEYMLLATINREYNGYILSLKKSKLRDGIRHIFSISRLGNQYLQLQQPWVLTKGNDEEKSRAATVIGLCCNLACLLATLLFPFMPTTSRTIYAQLNVQEKYIDEKIPYVTMQLKSGHQIGKPAPLFEKITTAQVENLKQRYSGSQEKKV